MLENVKLLEINAQDVLGISAPVTKLIETIAAAIGKFYEPYHVTRMNKAEAERIKYIGEVVSDIGIKMLYTKDGISIDNTELSALAYRQYRRTQFQELRKQQNIEAVNQYAYEEIKGKENVNEEPVNLDWLNNFYAYIENVSDEKMQIIWGKILAGEVEKPGRYSLRTLDALRKMTMDDATIFQKIVPLILKCSSDGLQNNFDYFILSNLKFEDYGVTFDDIIKMDEAGLMMQSGSISVKVSIPSKGTASVKGCAYDIVLRNNSDEEVCLEQMVYLLTATGKELYNMVIKSEIKKPEERYYEECINVFESKDITRALIKTNKKMDLEMILVDSKQKIL